MALLTWSRTSIFLVVFCVSICLSSATRMSVSDKVSVLNLHNQLRCSAPNDTVGNSPIYMPAMSWDSDLESLAQQWIDTCPNNDISNPPYSVGSNWAGSTSGTSTPIQLAGFWANERSSWAYSTSGTTAICTADCGHYTQMIWANSLRVGCATNTNACSSYSNQLVCLYSPAGNFNNQVPYPVTGDVTPSTVKNACDFQSVTSDFLQPSCSSNCANGGVCTSRNYCKCPNGFTGPFCENSATTSNVPNIYSTTFSCNSNTDCIEAGGGSCCSSFFNWNLGLTCGSAYSHPAGWTTGANGCAVSVCSNPCQNGGSCADNNLCICPDGYSGAQCQTPTTTTTMRPLTTIAPTTPLPTSTPTTPTTTTRNTTTTTTSSPFINTTTTTTTSAPLINSTTTSTTTSAPLINTTTTTTSAPLINTTTTSTTSAPFINTTTTTSAPFQCGLPGNLFANLSSCPAIPQFGDVIDVTSDPSPYGLVNSAAAYTYCLSYFFNIFRFASVTPPANVVNFSLILNVQNTQIPAGVGAYWGTDGVNYPHFIGSLIDFTTTTNTTGSGTVPFTFLFSTTVPVSTLYIALVGFNNPSFIVFGAPSLLPISNPNVNIPIFPPYIIPFTPRINSLSAGDSSVQLSFSFYTVRSIYFVISVLQNGFPVQTINTVATPVSASGAQNFAVNGLTNGLPYQFMITVVDSQTGLMSKNITAGIVTPIAPTTTTPTPINANRTTTTTPTNSSTTPPINTTTTAPTTTSITPTPPPAILLSVNAVPSYVPGEIVRIEFTGRGNSETVQICLIRQFSPVNPYCDILVSSHAVLAYDLGVIEYVLPNNLPGGYYSLVAGFNLINSTDWHNSTFEFNAFRVIAPYY